MILPASPETIASLENSDAASAAVARDILTPVAPARVGKIARLPRRVREELNQRLEEGEQGTVLVEWLNGRPEVNEVLRAQFEGRAINAQNLSDWRQGGFRDWCRHRAAWDRAALAREEAEDFEQLTGVGCGPVADKLNGVAMAALSELFSEAMAMEAGPKRQRLMLAAMRELGRLRRAEMATMEKGKGGRSENRETREGEGETGLMMVKREGAMALRSERRDGDVEEREGGRSENWEGEKLENRETGEAEEEGEAGLMMVKREDAKALRSEQRDGDEEEREGGKDESGKLGAVEKRESEKGELRSVEKLEGGKAENVGGGRRGRYDYAEVRRTVQMLKSRGKTVPAHLVAFLAEWEAAGKTIEKG